MPPKKKRKILTSEEVLKDIQKFLDKEDNENISDEDVNLDELDDEKYFCVISLVHRVKLLVIFAFISLYVF